MADFTFKSYAPQVKAQTQAVIDRALEKCGLLAESYAKKLCPTKTGRLKNSITHEQQDEKTMVIGTDVEYAPFVELGHRQEPGRYVPAIGKRLKRAWVPPKAFLRPAAENHANEFRSIIENEFKSMR